MEPPSALLPLPPDLPPHSFLSRPVFPTPNAVPILSFLGGYAVSASKDLSLWAIYLFSGRHQNGQFTLPVLVVFVGATKS